MKKRIIIGSIIVLISAILLYLSIKFTMISSFITVLLFILYIIGHLFRLSTVKATQQETLCRENLTVLDECNEYNYRQLVDKIDENTLVFSLSSLAGFEYIDIYKIDIDKHANDQLKLIHLENNKHTFINIKPDNKIYIALEILEYYNACHIDLRKNDGIKISFDISQSGENGEIQTNYKSSLTLKGFIYYMCT